MLGRGKAKKIKPKKGKKRARIRSKTAASKKIPTYGAIVPRSVVEQARSFTAPRGRLEMGGLLVGHVDDQGRNVCVAGFFPEQIQSTPTYCEFDGSWMAICTAALAYANEAPSGDGSEVPSLRIIGWIHTHPDLGIFLSGTDQSTYRANMRYSPDGRFLAVVVDPLREEEGVFTSPDRPTEYSEATGSLEMSDALSERYLRFLERMEDVRKARGDEALPFIITGDLRRAHVSEGNPDDYLESYLQAIPDIQRSISRLEDSERRVIERVDSHILELITRFSESERDCERMVGSRIDSLRSEFSSVADSLSCRISSIEGLCRSLEGVFMSLEALRGSMKHVRIGAPPDTSRIQNSESSSDDEAIDASPLTTGASR